MFNKWIVLECDICNERNYFYGTLSDFDKDELRCCTNSNNIKIDYKDWNANDLAIICSNELEDRNKHSIINLPIIMLKDIKNKNIFTEEQIVIIMKIICKTLLKED